MTNNSINYTLKTNTMKKGPPFCSYFTPYQFYRLHDSNIKLLDETIGHWPQIEAPQQVRSAYNDFLAEIKKHSL
jgi:hypothetical protein